MIGLMPHPNEKAVAILDRAAEEVLKTKPKYHSLESTAIATLQNACGYLLIGRRSKMCTTAPGRLWRRLTKLDTRNS